MESTLLGHAGPHAGTLGGMIMHQGDMPATYSTEVTEKYEQDQ